MTGGICGKLVLKLVAAMKVEKQRRAKEDMAKRIMNTLATSRVDDLGAAFHQVQRIRLLDKFPGGIMPAQPWRRRR